MQHVLQYIAGLTEIIKAGADLRFTIDGTTYSVIKIELDYETQDLLITCLSAGSPYDQAIHLPLRTPFTLTFADYPNAIRNAGWQ